MAGSSSPPRLHDHHRRELEVGSGLSEAIVEARGYYTATTKTELSKLGFTSYQQLVPAIVIPLYRPDGTRAGCQIKPDVPRIRDNKPVKYESPAKQKNVLDVHPLSTNLLADPNIPIIITEGAKKADSATGAWRRPVICLSGVENWRGQNDLGGVCALAGWNDIPFKGVNGPRRVYIAFDSDIAENRNVKRAAEKLAAHVKSKGGEVKYFAFSPDKGAKVGLDDYIVANGPINPLIQNATDYPPGWAREEKSDKGRRAIVVNNRDLDEKLADAIEVLDKVSPPAWFIRDADYVRVGTTQSGAPVIQRHSPGTIQVALASAASWVIDLGEDKGVKLTSPPKEVCEGILNSPRPSPKTPFLAGIARCPLALGTAIVDTNGYHPESGWYVQHSVDIVPWAGTPSEAAEYFQNEVLHDFPFVDAASKAHAVALWLLPYVRPLITGPTPLHFIDSPTPGSGKSKLAKACLYSSLGRNVEISKVAHSDEEFDKELFSLLLEGHPAIILDNLGRKMASAELAAVLTTNRIRGRILGLSETRAAAVNAIFAMTSNNGNLSTDIARRAIWIRIDPLCEDPEKRTGWRHPDVDEWAIANQGILTGAALSIVRSWLEAGKPVAAGNPVTKGSFESWVNVIGGILAHVGVAGFLANDEQLKRQGASEVAEWPEFYRLWWATYNTEPVTIGQLREIAVNHDILLSAIGDKGERSQVTRLGGALRKMLSRVFGGLRTQDAGMLDGKSRLRLEVIDSGAVSLVPAIQPATNPVSEDLFSGTSQDDSEGILI